MNALEVFRREVDPDATITDLADWVDQHDGSVVIGTLRVFRDPNEVCELCWERRTSKRSRSKEA